MTQPLGSNPRSPPILERRASESDDGSDTAGFMLFDTILAFDHAKTSHPYHRERNASRPMTTWKRSTSLRARRLAFSSESWSARCRAARPSDRTRSRVPVPISAATSSSEPSAKRRNRSRRVTSIKSCCRSGSMQPSKRLRSPCTGPCVTSTRRRTCISFEWVSLSIVGSSPEMLVRVEGRRVETHPIAGTRPRGRGDEDDLRLAEEAEA